MSFPVTQSAHPHTLSSDSLDGTVIKGHQGAVWSVSLAGARTGCCSCGCGGGGASGPDTDAPAPPFPALLLTGSADKTAKVWVLPADGVKAASEVRASGPASASARHAFQSSSFAPARTLAGHHSEWVRAVDLLGPRLALTGGDDGRAVVWDVETGCATRVVRTASHGGAPQRRPGVRAARFVCGGHGGGGGSPLFATGDEAGQVTLWDGRDRAACGVAVGSGAGRHTGPVTAVATPSPSSSSSSASSPLLVSVGADGAVHAWDVRGGAFCRAIPDLGLGALAAAAFTPCGTGVAVGGAAGRVVLVQF
jgi:WD40 repeat protein